MNKYRTLCEMKKRLEDLKEAWVRCSYIFSNTNIDCNDYIAYDYPFDLSFDEINVVKWIDSSLGKIEKELKE